VILRDLGRKILEPGLWNLELFNITSRTQRSPSFSQCAVSTMNH